MGSDTPLEACGFGFGDVVVMELLSAYNKLPTFPKKECDVVISALSIDDMPSMHGEAIQVANMFREAGLTVELVLEPRKMKWVLKHALKKNAPFLALIGPDEWNRKEGKSIVIKDMYGESQSVVPVAELPSWASERTTSLS
jgi:histidyl-tRNA synthetase